MTTIEHLKKLVVNLTPSAVQSLQMHLLKVLTFPEVIQNREAREVTRLSNLVLLKRISRTLKTQTQRRLAPWLNLVMNLLLR